MPPPLEPDDLCDRLLEPRAAPVIDEQRRDEIFGRTLGVLRARRRQRRLIVAAALAASFAGGMLAMHLWQAASDVPEESRIVQRPEPPAPLPERTPRPEPPRGPDPSLPAAVLERLAELADSATRAEHFLLAGKSYEKQGELPAALRCYRQALEPGGIDLAIAAGDSYLLMVLKNARQKEKRHAQKDT